MKENKKTLAFAWLIVVLVHFVFLLFLVDYSGELVTDLVLFVAIIFLLRNIIYFLGGGEVYVALGDKVDAGKENLPIRTTAFIVYIFAYVGILLKYM
ncbi:hypothetical protein E0Z06_02840 [Rheinheimera sp. D18]|uniref:hypothetical protein n=1 Tax=Rheinheimera sp. D18 TaxID=2545632 RepID=UPI0010468432|nr:hypothetical protein [Rheinheimera sp. D18]QBL08525.1 hypothetical protein E0Z06_02840 [Rheinheimera sp. D18]